MQRALATIWSNLETNIFEFDFLSSGPFRLMIVVTVVCIDAFGGERGIARRKARQE
jgi:hypothetical protein